jgi:hypothetical protein
MPHNIFLDCSYSEWSLLSSLHFWETLHALFLLCLLDILCWDAVWPPQGVRDTGSWWLWEFLWGLWTQVSKPDSEEPRHLKIPAKTLPPPLTRTFFPQLRLHNPTECPYNGSRRDDCQCRKDYTAAGFSSFQKIRIDLSSMQIISEFREVSYGNGLLLLSTRGANMTCAWLGARSWVTRAASSPVMTVPI